MAGKPHRARPGIAAIGTLALLLLLCLAVASTAIAAESENSKRRVIKVSYSEAVSRFHDAPPTSPDAASKGDIMTATGKLRNMAPQFGKKRGKLVGSERLRLVWKNQTVVIATLTATLPGGTIRAMKTINVSRTRAVLRITGGTGAFAHAQGSVTSLPLGQDPSGHPLFARIYNLTTPA